MNFEDTALLVAGGGSCDRKETNARHCFPTQRTAHDRWPKESFHFIKRKKEI